ncbi:hypothetical protein MRX96_047120 [Rhipicephalus microplus]
MPPPTAFLIGFARRDNTARKAAFGLNTPSSAQSSEKVFSSCLDSSIAAMQFPPWPSSELLQPESAAWLGLFQPESFVAAPPVTQGTTSVTTASKLTENCISGSLCYRRRRY